MTNKSLLINYCEGENICKLGSSVRMTRDGRRQDMRDTVIGSRRHNEEHKNEKAVKPEEIPVQLLNFLDEVTIKSFECNLRNGSCSEVLALVHVHSKEK